MKKLSESTKSTRILIIIVSIIVTISFLIIISSVFNTQESNQNLNSATQIQSQQNNFSGFN